MTHTSTKSAHHHFRIRCGRLHADANDASCVPKTGAGFSAAAAEAGDQDRYLPHDRDDRRSREYGQHRQVDQAERQGIDVNRTTARIGPRVAERRRSCSNHHVAAVATSRLGIGVARLSGPCGPGLPPAGPDRA